MNTVLTKEVNGFFVYFTHRHGEFRIVVEVKETGEKDVIARLNGYDLGLLKNGEDIKVSEGEGGSLFASTVAVIFPTKRRINAVCPIGTIELNFTEEDWESISDYMFNGKEGNLSEDSL